MGQREREKTLLELAKNVERIARLAYLDAAEPVIETLAKDQFIDVLHDEDMQLKLRENQPGSLCQALDTALRLESYQLASRQTKPVREALLEKRNSADGKKEYSNPLSVELLQQLVDALQACKSDCPAPVRSCKESRIQPGSLGSLRLAGSMEKWVIFGDNALRRGTLESLLISGVC